MQHLTVISNAILTMTSLELVDFINAERRQEANDQSTAEFSIEPAMLRHSDFMVKLEKHPGIDSPKFSAQYKDSTGRTLKCYRLPKRECELMVMSESLLVQARMYDRLAELEAKQAAPVMALPQDYIQALESLLASKKSEQLAIAERDHAIATKAQIGSKREATSMATASAARKETAKLKDQLGFNTRHATVIAVEGASGKKFGKQDWRPLKAWCKENGASSVTVPCARYGKAQAWPAGAWGAVYGVDLVELFGEVAA